MLWNCISKGAKKLLGIVVFPVVTSSRLFLFLPPFCYTAKKQNTFVMNKCKKKEEKIYEK